MNKTIFVDLDGTCFKHVGSLTRILELGVGDEDHCLPGVVQAFNDWAYQGHHIVITTARPESLRDFTKRQLEAHGLFYDQLVMGIPRGPRVVINDTKPAHAGEPELVTAIGISLPRNKGLVDVDV